MIEIGLFTLALERQTVFEFGRADVRDETARTVERHRVEERVVRHERDDVVVAGKRKRERKADFFAVDDPDGPGGGVFGDFGRNEFGE